MLLPARESFLPTLTTVLLATVATLAACKSAERASPADASLREAPSEQQTETAASVGMPVSATSAFEDLTYLSSDALMGRYTGTPGNEAAAAYIQRSLIASRVAPVGGSKLLLSPVRLIKRDAIETASASFGESPTNRTTLSFPDELLPITRTGVQLRISRRLPHRSLAGQCHCC